MTGRIVIVRKAPVEDHHALDGAGQFIRQFADDAVALHVRLATEEVEFVGRGSRRPCSTSQAE